MELEPEVTAWLDALPDSEFGHVERYIDLLAEHGALLSEPFTRQLDGKLRELRFYLGRNDPNHSLHRHRPNDRAAHRLRQDQTP